MRKHNALNHMRCFFIPPAPQFRGSHTCLLFKASFSVFLSKTVSFFGGCLGVENAKVLGAWVEPASDAAETPAACLD